MASLSARTAELEKRIVELERRNELMSQQKAQHEKTAAQTGKRLEEIQKKQQLREQELREQFAGLRVMNNRLQSEIQGLTGRTEMAEYQLGQRGKSLEDSDRLKEARFDGMQELIESNQDRLKKIEAYLSLETSNRSGTPSAAPAPQHDHDTQLSEEALYRSAKSAFDRGEFETSREQFEKLIQTYPTSKNADNAQFWIGEVYYREKWYEKSILEYQKVIENYPKGNKLPASMLKQGLAFSNIGDTANARLILKQLVKKYPKTSEAAIAKQKIKALK